MDDDKDIEPTDEDPRLAALGMKFVNVGAVDQLKGLGLGVEMGNAGALKTFGVSIAGDRARLQAFGAGLAASLPKADVLHRALGPGFDAMAAGVASQFSKSSLCAMGQLDGIRDKLDPVLAAAAPAPELITRDFPTLEPITLGDTIAERHTEATLELVDQVERLAEGQERQSQLLVEMIKFQRTGVEHAQREAERVRRAQRLQLAVAVAALLVATASGVAALLLRGG